MQWGTHIAEVRATAQVESLKAQLEPAISDTQREAQYADMKICSVQLQAHLESIAVQRDMNLNERLQALNLRLHSLERALDERESAVAERESAVAGRESAVAEREFAVCGLR